MTTTKSERKIIYACMIGNILEFYDFMLFGFLSPVLAPLFFPSSDPLTSLILTLATYGVGYFMRPLGAIFFGHVGDKYGRKRSLSLSIILMSIPTVLVAVLPTYDHIGLAAPLILIGLRLVQGFCTGGEYNGAALYTVENTQRKGFHGSLITISSALGGLVGVFVSSLVTAPFMPDHAWRLAFLFGGIIGGLGLYMRRNLKETIHSPPSFKDSASFPLVDVVKNHRLSLLCTLGIAGCSGAMYNMSFAYISIFLTTYGGWQLSNSLLLMSTGTLIYILSVPLFGHLADQYGTRKIMTTGALATIILVPLLFLSLLRATYVVHLVAIQVCFALLSAWFQAPMNAHMATLFPPHLRYSGVAFSYSMGLALFGGSTPMICSLLIRYTQNTLTPAIYLVALSVVGLVCVHSSRQLKQIAENHT